MPLELRDQTATVVGVLTVEEVEPFVGWLRTTERPKVNLRRCTHLHTGAVQALLVFRPKIGSVPSDHFLASHILPLLDTPPPNASPAAARPEPAHADVSPVDAPARDGSTRDGSAPDASQPGRFDASDLNVGSHQP